MFADCIHFFKNSCHNDICRSCSCRVQTMSFVVQGKLIWKKKLHGKGGGEAKMLDTLLKVYVCVNQNSILYTGIWYEGRKQFQFQVISNQQMITRIAGNLHVEFAILVSVYPDAESNHFCPGASAVAAWPSFDYYQLIRPEMIINRTIESLHYCLSMLRLFSCVFKTKYKIDLNFSFYNNLLGESCKLDFIFWR